MFTTHTCLPSLYVMTVLWQTQPSNRRLASDLIRASFNDFKINLKLNLSSQQSAESPCVGGFGVCVCGVCMGCVYVCGVCMGCVWLSLHIMYLWSSMAASESGIPEWCVAGLAISLYAFYVEWNKHRDSTYTALCDFTDSMSCSKVLTSK